MRALRVGKYGISIIDQAWQPPDGGQAWMKGDRRVTGNVPVLSTHTQFFFFGFYKSRKRKLHCHETSSNAIALVKTTGPWCRAFAFADCDPTPTLFKVAS